MFPQVAATIASLGALALPTSCAACGKPDDTVCRGCTEAIAAGLWPGSREVTPTPCPEGMPVAFAAGPYEGPLARLVTAYKDDGRRDVRAVLAPVLSAALDLALRSQPEHRRALARHTRPVLVVPVPTSRAARRRRGDAPLLDLARAAVSGFAGARALVRGRAAPAPEGCRPGRADCTRAPAEPRARHRAATQVG